MLLQNKNALITGAARGIGNATLEVFAREGANVWAFARKPSQALEAQCRELAQRYGVWIRPLYCELTNESQRKAAFAAVLADKQPLDVLVNNAGVMGPDKMFQLTAEAEMRSLFDVNFFAMLEVCRFATRLMARRKSGSVVNVASVAGLDGDSRIDYSASKAAVIAATKKLARELAPLGIRANALAPGYTQTDLVADLGEKVVEETIAKILLGRPADPEEIANAAAFLGSDLSSYVTGQVLRVDGGLL